jgi:hypothetical protein
MGVRIARDLARFVRFLSAFKVGVASLRVECQLRRRPVRAMRILYVLLASVTACGGSAVVDTVSSIDFVIEGSSEPLGPGGR